MALLDGKPGFVLVGLATFTADPATFIFRGPITISLEAYVAITTFATFASIISGTTSRLKGSGCSGSIDRKRTYVLRIRDRAMHEASKISSAFVAWPNLGSNTLVCQLASF